MRTGLLDGPSRLSAASLMTSAPPLLMVRLLRTRKGVLVPPCASNNVFVAPPGALMTRLLMLRVLGNPAAVVASLFTVLVPALVMETSVSPIKGGTFSDQLAPFSH